MGINELKINNKLLTNKAEILKALKDNKLYWLIDSEVEEAIIEIKKDTLIWHSGIYKHGKWHFGIFKNGTFYGIWENGIWESGTFKGKWKSGVNSPI